MYRTDLIKTALGEGALLQAHLSKVAKLAGVSHNTVKRARDGENLSIKSLSAVAGALGLNMADLFTFETENQTASPQASSLSLKN